MPQQDQQHHQRTTWPQLLGIHFGTACVSTAWSLRNITSPRERTWSALVQDAEALMADELTVCVLLNFCCSVFGLVALGTSTLFLGRLSALETHRLQQRLFKCIMHKIVIVRVVIQPDVRDIAGWLAWLAVVAYLRGFVGAAKDRLESLISVPAGQPGRHARGVCLLLLMMICNAAAFMVMRMMWASSIARILLCAYDTAVVAIEGLRIMLRYAVNMMDRYSSLGGANPSAPPIRTAQDADLPAGTAAATAAHADGGWDLGWSGKGSFQYHAELVADVLIHAVTLVHYGHVWALHGFHFQLMDFVLFLEMRGVMLSLVRRLNGHLSYRAATKHLDTTFRDVRPGDGTAIDCSICLDEIAHVAKQLPCGHVFHLSCLRAWLQQSGSENFTCPNCRQPIITDGGIATFQRPDWWIVRLWDRLGMWLTLVVEPLLLMLLINITVWLGGRAQVRRRAPRTQPASVGEGFGETPGPSSRHISRGRRVSRTDDDDSSDLETEQKTTHEEAEEFDNVDALVIANSEEADGIPRNAHRNNRRSTRRNNGLNPDDFDVDANIGSVGAATAERARRGLRGTGCGDEGGCCVAGPSASGPAAAMRSRRAGRGLVMRLDDLQEDQVISHRGVGRRARQMTAGDDGGVETAPSTMEAARRPSALRRAPQPGEVPSVSGEVLHQVSEMARRIRRTISVSIRSSLAAVASADSDGGEEVSSRRQEAQSRAAAPQEGAAGAGW